MDLQQILEQAVRFYPDRTGVVCGGTRLTYRAFAERVHRLRSALHGRGLRKGDRLAVLMYNCHRYFEIYYATAEMGALVIPLNIRLSAAEIAYILNDSGSAPSGSGRGEGEIEPGTGTDGPHLPYVDLKTAKRSRCDQRESIQSRWCTRKGAPDGSRRAG